MRLLAFSDLHDEEAAFQYIARMAKDYDYVLSCGDLTRASVFLEDAVTSIPNLLLIPGNWESERVAKEILKSPKCLHQKRIDVDGGHNLVGFGFSPPTPFNTDGELADDKIHEGICNLDIDEDTVLVLHAPPKGFFDRVGSIHTGSESILWIIERKKPMLALFGHIHEHLGMARYGHSLLLKLPPANGMRICSIEVEGRDVRAEFVSL